MKTTIDISDDLLARSKQLSRDLHITLRELVSEGLTQVIAQKSATRSFHIEAVTFAGEGLAPEFRNAPWSAFRDAAYGGYGS